MSTVFLLLLTPAICAFLLNTQHLLLSLLALEGGILAIVFLVSMAFPQSIFITVLTLTLAACETSLGLSLLVAMVRSHGNTNVNSLCL